MFILKIKWLNGLLWELQLYVNLSNLVSYDAYHTFTLLFRFYFIFQPWCRVNFLRDQYWSCFVITQIYDLSLQY